MCVPDPPSLPCRHRSAMPLLGSFRSDDLFSGDDRKAFVTFKGCMESEITFAGMGAPECPLDKLFWFNEVEKSLSGSAKDTYVATRSRIL